MVKYVSNEKAFLEKVKIIREKSVEDSCEYVTKQIKDSMKSGSYKRWYSKKRDGSYHWSSKPGDPPAPDVGLLKGSISYQTSDGKSGGVESPAGNGDGVKKPVARKDETIGAIGTDLDYGFYVEVGTKKAMPRPYLRPALVKSWEAIQGFFRKNSRNILK